MTVQWKMLPDRLDRSAKHLPSDRLRALRALILVLGAGTGTVLAAAAASAQPEVPDQLVEHDTEQSAPPAAGARPSSEQNADLEASGAGQTNPEDPESVSSPPQAAQASTPPREVRLFHPESPTEPPQPGLAPDPLESAPDPEDVAPQLQFFPVNIGLFSPIEVIPRASTRRFGAHIGALYGDIGASDGFHANGLVGRVRHDSVGFGASGLWTEVGGNTRGYEAAGLVHRVRGSLTGAQSAGLVAMSSDADGLQAGGVFAMAHDLEGTQMGGVVTVARDVNGAQFGGIVTVAADVEGTQIAGLVARADGFRGAQIAGIANLATDLGGVQVGLVNHAAGSVRGAQVGLVNVAREVDGAQVGLVNLAGNTHHQAVVWTDEQLVAQAGWRTSWRPLYSQVGFGINPRGFESTKDDRKQLVPSYAFGGRVPLGSLFLDLDVMYSVEVSGNRRDHGESTAHAIRQRAAVGYQVVDWLALTAGAGVRQRWDTEGDFELGPTVFGGVQLL